MKEPIKCTVFKPVKPSELVRTCIDWGENKIRFGENTDFVEASYAKALENRVKELEKELLKHKEIINLK